jgi:CP family cyanate transporter-like MFS transporter
VAVAVIAVALNLRPAIVAVGPMTEAIQADTGLGSTAVSLLTTLPLVCLGAFAATATLLNKRVGIERSVFVSVGLIVAGIALRLVPSTGALYLGMILAGSGIAVANVLVPALVKRDLSRRLGLAMAGYSVALQTGATIAAGMTASIGAALHLSWRPTLAIWGILAVLALFVWAPLTRRRGPDSAEHVAGYPVWRSRLGWAGAAFIGLQSGIYFALTAWLPTLWQGSGLSADRSGQMMLLLGASGILGSLPMPILAARRPDQRPLVAVLTLMFTIGLTGLLLAPGAWAPLWAVALGLAQGGGLSLALTLFALRCRTAEAAAQLSGMAQSAGYLIAAAAPLAVGLLRDLVGGWTVPLLALAALLVPFTIAGWALARPRCLEDEVVEDEVTAA